MANQFREAVIPRLAEVVGRGELCGGTCPTRNRRGTCPGLLLSGGNCPRGLVRRVDVLHSLKSTALVANCSCCKHSLNEFHIGIYPLTLMQNSLAALAL